jgi:demethylmenaquinone methyltransferase/2-methoxy-6-polyprenyl-1,4-benzoquinol methylase
MSTPDKRTASFGYREVEEDEKPALVGRVFSSVARRYDLMNDLMSAGVHRLWKDAAVDWLNPQMGWTVVDAAGGTGDIAFRIAARAPKAKIIVCDINQEMLEQGKNRAKKHRRANIEWLCGDAEDLPLPDGMADAFTIAFGIRNVTHIDKVLAEAFRVLKPGGRFLCLEFSKPAPGLDVLYDRYSFSVLPRLGQLVARDREAYQYLAESIRRFPAQKPFAKMIEQSGIAQVTFRNLSGGIAAMHSGWKL